VILQHAVLIYAAEPHYHFKAPSSPDWTTALYEGLRIFAMPPFFALAGWAAMVSLRRRGAMDFLRERAVRLLPPLALGILVLGPLIKFIELKGGRDLGLAGFRLVEPLAMGLPEFLPLYFTRGVLLTWSHLWFIAYLVLYSVLLLPLLAGLARNGEWQRPAAWWMAYLPAVPLAMVLFVLDGYWPYLPNLVHDGANFVYFALCFLTGTLIACWPNIEQCLRREAPRLLLLALIGWVAVVLLGEGSLGRLSVGVTAWGFIGSCWGFAMRWSPCPSPVFRSLTEATFPIYVIHHLPLLLLALWLVPLGWPEAVAIAVVTISTVIISTAFYQIAVRPFAPMRWVFGGSSRA